MTSLEFRDRLARRARCAKVPITIAMLDPLEAYFRLLTLWNARINLTALPLETPTDETFDRLLIEPLAAARHVKEAPATWLDLGSGGGSPAIPMKIARPALALTMIESRERKSAFLREAVRVLNLADAQVVTARFEELTSDPTYAGCVDLVTVRAVKADDELYRVVRALLRAGGQLLMFRPLHVASADPEGFIRTATTRLIDSPQSFLTAFLRR